MKKLKDIEKLFIVFLLIVGTVGIITNIDYNNKAGKLFYVGYKNIDLVHNMNIISNRLCDNPWGNIMPMDEMRDTGSENVSRSMKDWYRIGSNQMFEGFSMSSNFFRRISIYVLFIGIATGMIISRKFN